MTSKMLRVSAAVAVLFSLCFLCSCYDASDIEETAYLIALGIDRNNKENTDSSELENEFTYTFQLAAPLAGGGEKGGSNEYDSGNPTVSNIVITADSFYSAKNLLTNYLSKVLNMSHLKTIVCSWQAAETSLIEHSELFSREREIRPGTFVCVSAVSAQEFLKAVNPELEGSTAKYYELVNSDKTLIYAPVKRLGDFIEETQTGDGSAALPIAWIAEAESSDGEKDGTGKIYGRKPELKGMAVLKGNNIVGTLGESEALMYNILTGHTEDFVFTVFNNSSDSNSSYSTEVSTISFKCRTESVPKISVKLNKKFAMDVSVRIKLFAECMGKRIDADNSNGYKTPEKLSSLLQAAFEKEMTDFLDKTAYELNADILKIGRKCKKNYLTIEELEKSDFEKNYKNSKFSVKVILTMNEEAQL